MKNKILEYFNGDFLLFYGTYLSLTPCEQSGDNLKVLCPFEDHNDHNPSFSFNCRTGLCQCFGCKFEGDIFSFFAKLRGLNVKTDFPEILNRIASDFGIEKSQNKKVQRKLVETYDYTDENGKLLFQVCRYDPKDFKQRRPDGKGRWSWNLKGVEPVLYNLSMVLKATEIIIVEGEADSNCLTSLGFVATTCPMGAGKWRKSYSDTLISKNVIVLPDNDDPGREHAEKIAQSLDGKAESIKILSLPDLPDKGDVSDWLDAQPDRETASERLALMIEGCEPWKPEPKPSSKRPRKLTKERQATQAESQKAEQQAKTTAKKKKTPTQSEILLQEATKARLFHTPDNNVFARLKINDHYETWNVRSTAFKNWLSNSFYKKEAKSPSAQAMTDALNTVEGIGQFDRPQEDVYLRTAEINGRIYIDLANDTWEVVEVSESGWKVIKESPVYFRRTKGMLALPCPTERGRIEELRHFLNLPKEDDEATWKLLVAWLLQATRPQGPYPILALNGEQGTAKSTVSKLLRLLVDPSIALLRTMPRDERDLAITANNNWTLNFDNLSGMPTWFSDAICRISTGGGFATRELYKNDDECIFNFMRPIILNGIDDLVYRHDLADRTIFITLLPIPESERIRESELMARFSTVQSRIFGAILTALSAGLKNIGRVYLNETPRMADFAYWIQAIEPALPWESGGFLQVYYENRQQLIEQAVESDSIASAIRKLIESINNDTWEGSPNDLLIELDEREPENVKKEKYWPKNACILSRRLKRASSFLRKIGIDITIGRTKTGRFVTLRRVTLR